MGIFGFASPSERVEAQSREVGFRSRIQSEKQRVGEKRLKQLANYEARKDLGLLKKKELVAIRKKKEANSYSRGLRKELDRIRNTIQSNQRVEQRQQQDVRQSVVVQNRPVNFFEHKSEQEVYGDDEGLTFFDSKKRGGNGSTGEFFGF